MKTQHKHGVTVATIETSDYMDAIRQRDAENAKLREQLADIDIKLEEAIDMLVNLHDLGNLDEEWAGKVAMVLAKNDK